MNLQEIINQINIEFSNINYPNGEEIVYDNSGNHLECNEIKNAFEDKNWKEITFDIIRSNEASLSFLSEKGFRYYLPSYIIECLKNYERFDTLTDEIVFHLTLPNEIDTRIKIMELQKSNSGEIDIKAYFSNTLQSSNLRIHNFIKKMSHFNKGQGNAINNFLEYLDNNKSDSFLNNEPKIASYRYWFQFK